MPEDFEFREAGMGSDLLVLILHHYSGMIISNGCIYFASALNIFVYFFPPEVIIRREHNLLIYIAIFIHVAF